MYHWGTPLITIYFNPLLLAIKPCFNSIIDPTIYLLGFNFYQQALVQHPVKCLAEMSAIKNDKRCDRNFFLQTKHKYVWLSTKLN